MTKIDLKSGATLNGHGQMIIPGRPKSLDRNSPLHPRNGAPKNFQIADNVAHAHGVHPSDIEKNVIGAHRGHHPNPAAGIAVHPGMLHVTRDGSVITGISKTQKAFDDEPNSKLILRNDTPEDDHNRPLPVSYHKYPPIAALNGRLPDKIRK